MPQAILQALFRPGDFKFARITDGDTYAYTLKKPIKRIPLSENVEVEVTPNSNSPKDSSSSMDRDENPRNSKDSNSDNKHMEQCKAC